MAAAVAEHGPLCVGIDPHPGLLASWGLSQDAAGLERFALTCVEAFGGHVALVKPQAAFFEAHGSRGVAVLERVVADLRGSGTLVLVDAKRGDIGSTMAAYAAAYLTEGSPLAGDAVTASPYLGFGSLDPALEAAAASGRGIFVLALTSNPEGASVQRAVNADGRSVAQSIVDAAARSPAGPLRPARIRPRARLRGSGGDGRRPACRLRRGAARRAAGVLPGRAQARPGDRKVAVGGGRRAALVGDVITIKSRHASRGPLTCANVPWYGPGHQRVHHPSSAYHTRRAQGVTGGGDGLVGGCWYYYHPPQPLQR